MEAALFSGELFPPKSVAKASKDAFVAKKEDIDMIVRFHFASNIALLIIHLTVSRA